MTQEYIDIDLEDYIQFLLNKKPSEYIPIPNKSHDINVFELMCNIYDMNMNELFLNQVKKGNLVNVKKLASDNRVKVDYLNNEAVILSLLNNRINIFRYLISLENVDPCDQDFLLMRIAIMQKNKFVIDLLLKHPKILKNIFYHPQLIDALKLI